MSSASILLPSDRSIRDAPVLTVPEPWGLMLSPTWRGGMGLAVHSTARGRPTSDAPMLRGAFAGTKPAIHEIAWAQKEWNVCTRKLANQSHLVFMDLQEIEPGVGQNQSLAKLSRRYRAIIHACVLDLKEAANASGDDSLVAKYDTQCQLFEITELIWHLSEILFIECVSGSRVIPYLLEWLRWHKPEVSEFAQEIANQLAPDRHPEYWNVIKLLILHGRTEEARNLLLQHPARKHGVYDAYSSMDELLRKMPLQSHGTHSVSEFNLRWQQWREECLLRLSEGQFVNHGHLQHIAQLLCGDRDAFCEARDLCGSWYGLMVSRLLFSDPVIRALDLRLHAEPSMALMGDDVEVGVLDNILLAMLQYNIPEVISLISSSFGNWWSIAHLADLLHHAGQLESHQLEYGSSMREFLLLEYASSLMSHTSLWQVGADYFLQCPVYGKHYLEVYLDRIAPESDMMAIKLLRLCNKSGLEELACSICKKMAMQAKKNERMGSALNWAIRSKDASFSAAIADKFLSQYAESGHFPCLDMVDHLNPAMLINDQMIFLAKYREFHRLYSSSQLKDSAELLVSLLTSRLAPKKYWFMLLIDCLPLLELDQVVFASDQTYELLQCLEEVEELGLLNVSDDDMDDKAAHGEKVQLLRIGLATNLARAFLDNDGAGR